MSATLTISDAARVSGVSAHTLRYYERAGLLDPVDRVASGHRRYAEVDLARIEFLTKLRSTGMPIRKIREYADLLRLGDDTHEERLELLESHRDTVRAQLDVTAHTLELIEHKINYYRERLAQR